MKAIPLYVLRRSDGTDCTNNGISSRHDRLLCICPDGYIDIDEDNPPEEAVTIVHRRFCGKDIYHLEPLSAPKECGWMAGGNYAESCDDRFSEMAGGFYCAMAIHDRQETWEEYEMMSR